MSRKQSEGNSGLKRSEKTGHDSSTPAMDVELLDTVSQFELILKHFTEAGPAPAISRKALLFLQQHAEEIRHVIGSAKQTPEQWLSDFLAWAGGEGLLDADVFNAKAIALDPLTLLWDQFGGFPGTIQQWWTLFAIAMDYVAPQHLGEWEELARIVPVTEATIDSSRAVVSEMVERLKPSIDAGLVSIDLKSVASQDLPRAVALCYYWITRFTALSEVSFPSPTDVRTFAGLCKLDPPPANSIDELNLAVWLQQHPVWSGMLDTHLGAGHPILNVVRNGSKRPSTEFIHLVEIDQNGVMQRLRNIIPKDTSVICSTQHPADESWPLVLNLEWFMETSTFRRNGQNYQHIRPAKLSPAIWGLFQELLSAGKNGTTAESLMENLQIKKGALAQRKNQLKNALFPFGLTVPDSKYRLADT